MRWAHLLVNEHGSLLARWQRVSVIGDPLEAYKRRRLIASLDLLARRAALVSDKPSPDLQKGSRELHYGGQLPYATHDCYGEPLGIRASIFLGPQSDDRYAGEVQRASDLLEKLRLLLDRVEQNASPTCRNREGYPRKPATAAYVDHRAVGAALNDRKWKERVDDVELHEIFGVLDCSHVHACRCPKDFMRVLRQGLCLHVRH